MNITFPFFFLFVWRSNRIYNLQKSDSRLHHRIKYKKGFRSPNTHTNKLTEGEFYFLKKGMEYAHMPITQPRCPRWAGAGAGLKYALNRSDDPTVLEFYPTVLVCGAGTIGIPDGKTENIGDKMGRIRKLCSFVPL